MGEKRFLRHHGDEAGTRVNAKLLRKLEGQGAIELLKGGARGVRVSCQYRPVLGKQPRTERARVLKDCFVELSQKVPDLEIDLTTLSVSGQTVEALVPVEQFDQVERKLEEKDIRVDLVVDRKVV